MDKLKFSNEIFEICETATANNYIKKFKGKTLHPEITGGISDIVEVYMDHETFLDFDASLLPENYLFNIMHPDELCLGILSALFLNKHKEGKIEFQYFFCISEKKDEMNINPIKLLNLLADAAKKKGYDIDRDVDAEEEVLYINFMIPAKDNLSVFYKKHLKIFESLMAKAAKKMKAEILRGS